MNHPASMVNNEEGSAIVIALLALSVLTIIGLSSIDISTTELQIVRNEQIYQTNFYNAESAIMEALYALENSTAAQLNDRTFTTFVWLKKLNDNLDMTNIDNWDATNSSASATLPVTAEYAIVEKGVVRGESLDIAATSNLYDYIVLGHGNANNGEVLIEVGYKMRH